MNFIQYAALFASAMLAFLSAPVQADDDFIPVRVVVITTFQFGDDNDPTAGEFGNWVLYLPLPQTILSRKATISCVTTLNSKS
jgi:hypothetical protein